MLDFGFDRLVSCTCMHVSPAHVSNVDLFVFSGIDAYGFNSGDL